MKISGYPVNYKIIPVTDYYCKPTAKKLNNRYLSLLNLKIIDQYCVALTQSILNLFHLNVSIEKKSMN